MKYRAAFAILVGVVALISLAAPPAFARPSNLFPYSSIVPTITVNGDGLTPVTLKTSELAALPQTTIIAGVNGKTVSATGPLLSSLLSYAGLTYNSGCKNDELRYWVEATSANGSAVVITAGELDPGFGNRPAILAISENGGMLTSEGPTLVVPNDTGARDLAHITKITVGRAPVELADVTPACGATSLVTAPPPGQVLVQGDVKNPTTLSFAQLQALPQVSQTDSFLSGSSPTVDTESGPTLYSVVEAANPKFLACDSTDDLRFYVEVTSSEDGYSSLFSWAEIDPALNGGTGLDQSLLSLIENGTSQAAVGPRATAPGDVKGGRYVSGSAVITVFRAPTETRIPSCRAAAK
jgi:hypothetical protein